MRYVTALFASGLLLACSSGPAKTADATAPTTTTPAADAPAPKLAPPTPTAEPTVAKTVDPAPAPTPEPPGPPPPLPKDTKVLHVGDSMADALGKRLKMELRKRGIKNILEAKEATYIPQWAGFTMGFSGLIASHDPDMVIITLGGNETAMPDPTVRAEPVRRMVKQVGDRPCIWIAAPLWPGAPNTGIMKVIEENCAPCVYVDTNEYIKTGVLPDLKRLGDKVHPTIPERKRWAKFMIRWLLHNRDPDGKRVWDFKAKAEPPPPESVTWITDLGL